MLVAVDGWTGIPKTELGGRVAETLGGVLVDSGRFYRALSKACQDGGVDVADAAAVAAFCQGASLHIRFSREGWPVEQAQVAINGRWFLKSELADVAQPTDRLPAFAPLDGKGYCGSAWVCVTRAGIQRTSGCSGP